MSRIVVVVAMDAELRHLFPDGQLPKEARRFVNRAWYDPGIAGHQVTAVKTGIGMLNAAASLEWAIAEFRPEAVINYGCAGAHHRDIMPGDVIIGTETINIGALNLLRDGTEAHNGRGYEVAGERIFPAIIDADPGLLAAATAASEALPIEPWPQGVMWPPSIPWREQRYHRGPVASSEVWNQQLSRLDLLHERHGSLSEDNESSAFAHVSYVHGVPFLAIKDIANNEYHAASDLAEFSDFPTPEVGRRAAALVKETIARL